jgi:hypothetical protein
MSFEVGGWKNQSNRMVEEEKRQVARPPLVGPQKSILNMDITSYMLQIYKCWKCQKMKLEHYSGV